MCILFFINTFGFLRHEKRELIETSGKKQSGIYITSLV